MIVIASVLSKIVLLCDIISVEIGRAEKRFLDSQNKDNFWYLSSIFCKQTLLVAMNKTSNNGNILRRRTRDIKPCTLGEVLF